MPGERKVSNFGEVGYGGRARRGGEIICPGWS